MKANPRRLLVVAALGVAGFAVADPMYAIYPMGTLFGDGYSESRAISRSGHYAVGVSYFSSSINHPFIWPLGVGITELPNPPGSLDVPTYDVNDSGVVVGLRSTASSQTHIPLMWTNDAYQFLTLPEGSTSASDMRVNNNGIAVGTVNANGFAVWSNGGVSLKTATAANGAVLTLVRAINDSDVVIGLGFDPVQSRDVTVIHNLNSNVTTSINGISSDISNAGHITGSENHLPFIWTPSEGFKSIPLIGGFGQGNGVGVNSGGWVVGTVWSSGTSVPFVYDGLQSYRLYDRLTNPSGWEMAGPLTRVAGISDNGVIVGSAAYNGRLQGFVAVPVPEPASLSVVALGILATLRRRNARRSSQT